MSLADAGLTASLAVPPDLGLDFTSQAADAAYEVRRLWRADLDDARMILNSAPSAPAWQSIPLSWLVSGAAREAVTRSARPGAGMADVQRMRATVGLFAELDSNYGGGHARRALIHYLDDEVQRLLHGDFADSVGDALFSAAAQATLLAAWMSYDSGLHGLAQRYFIQALRLAETGHDRLLGGSVLDAMSHQATFLGRFTEAANLARAARAGTRGLAPASLTAHFSAMEAAPLPGSATGEAAIWRFRKPSGSSNGGIRRTTRTGSSTSTTPELAAEFGHCFRDLGEFPAAARHARVGIGNTRGPRSDFFVTMVLADSYLGAGEVELACQTALDAMNQAEQLRSARCVTYLRDFRARLAHVSSAAAVRQFHDEAAGYPIWQVTGDSSAS